MDYRAYSLDELHKMLTVDEMMNAIDMERVIVDFDSDESIAHFCHSLDLDGENSYIFLSASGDEIEHMNDEEIAQLVVSDMLSLVEDDPESYADEMSFYADIVVGGAA